jgi:hypothetical protein
MFSHAAENYIEDEPATRELLMPARAESGCPQTERSQVKRLSSARVNSVRLLQRGTASAEPCRGA